MKGNPSYQDVLDAMAVCDPDSLPDGFDRSRSYFLVHPETGEVYPPKAIWGLATGYGSRDFDAPSAKRWLEKIGFYVHDNRREQHSITFSERVRQALR